LLKVYSTMNNAIKLSSIDNGAPSTWERLGSSWDSEATYSDIYAWFNKYLANYMRYSKLEEGEGATLKVYFHDGSMLRFANYIYDISYILNPDKCGNVDDTNCRYGSDVFQFQFLSQSAKERFEPYAYSWDGTIDGAKYDAISGGSSYGCYDDFSLPGAGALCTKLIQLNNWKIPDDYPHKF